MISAGPIVEIYTTKTLMKLFGTDNTRARNSGCGYQLVDAVLLVVKCIVRVEFQAALFCLHAEIIPFKVLYNAIEKCSVNLSNVEANKAQRRLSTDR